MPGTNKPAAERLATRLRELREAAGNPSLRTIANRIGWNRSAVHDALSGTRIPGEDFVLCFATYFGEDQETLTKLRSDAYLEQQHHIILRRAALQSRRHVHKTLTETAHSIRALAVRWSAHQRVKHDGHAQDVRWRRPARWHELPENQPEQWRLLANACDELAAALHSLADFARSNSQPGDEEAMTPGRPPSPRSIVLKLMRDLVSSLRKAMRPWQFVVGPDMRPLRGRPENDPQRWSALAEYLENEHTAAVRAVVAFARRQAAELEKLGSNSQTNTTDPR